jgi:hypothetical protein
MKYHLRRSETTKAKDSMYLDKLENGNNFMAISLWKDFKNRKDVRILEEKPDTFKEELLNYLKFI